MSKQRVPPEEGLLPSEEGSYRERALESARALLPAMAEPRFWQLVERLSWPRRSAEPTALGAELAQQLDLTDCLEAHNRLQALSRDLEQTFARWEERTEQSIGLDEELERDLREHLVALGQQAYESARRNPAVARARAERDDFEASFGLVFLEALSRYSEAQLAAVLARLARPFEEESLAEGQVVQHERYGLGLVREEPWACRCRVSFPGGELLVDKRPALLH